MRVSRAPAASRVRRPTWRPNRCAASVPTNVPTLAAARICSSCWTSRRRSSPGDDLEQLRQKVLHGQVHPLRNPAVPRELRIVLAAAMDLDRERRHATAEGFAAADLQAVLLRCRDRGAGLAVAPARRALQGAAAPHGDGAAGGCAGRGRRAARGLGVAAGARVGRARRASREPASSWAATRLCRRSPSSWRGSAPAIWSVCRTASASPRACSIGRCRSSMRCVREGTRRRCGAAGARRTVDADGVAADGSRCGSPRPRAALPRRLVRPTRPHAGARDPAGRCALRTGAADHARRAAGRARRALRRRRAGPRSRGPGADAGPFGGGGPGAAAESVGGGRGGAR